MKENDLGYFLCRIAIIEEAVIEIFSCIDQDPIKKSKISSSRQKDC